MSAKVIGEDGPEYTYTRDPMAEWFESKHPNFIPYPDSPKSPEGKYYNYLHNTD